VLYRVDLGNVGKDALMTERGQRRSTRRTRSRRPLRQPDGRVHFAGDDMTNMSSWMQGVFESARDVTMAIDARAVARN
jgi:monoamine oxidase